MFKVQHIHGSLLEFNGLIDSILFGKPIALLVIFGCAFGAPTPRVEKQHPAQFTSENNKLIPGNTIKELESSLDGFDAIFKHPFGKIGMYR